MDYVKKIQATPRLTRAAELGVKRGINKARRRHSGVKKGSGVKGGTLIYGGEKAAINGGVDP